MSGPVINVTITGDAKGLQRTFTQVEDDAESFGSKLSGKGVAVGSFLGTAAANALPGLIDLGGELFALGQSYDTIAKKTETVFGASAGQVKTWADSVNESMGMSDEAVVGLATNMGDLLVPMGFAREEAAAMSTDTVELAAALSAWSGGQVDAAGAAEILTKAYLGERDGLKALGISISEADVSARLAAKGQDDLTGAALEQAKAIATQELIFEKSADAQTAWQDGTMDAVKAQNELTAGMEDAKAEIAKGLVPIVNAMVRTLVRDVIPAFKQVVGWVRANWPQIRAAVEPTINWIRETVGSVIEIVSVLWRKYGDEILGYIRDVWPEIQQVIEGVTQTIKGIIDLFLALLKGDWGAAWEALGAIIDGVWETIKGAIGMALDQIQFLISVGWETIKGTVTGALDAVADYVTGFPGRIATQARDMFKGIKNAATVVQDWVEDRFVDLVNLAINLPGRMSGVFRGMFDGIKEAFRTAINWVLDKWNGLDFSIPGFDPPGPGPKFGGITIGTPNLPLLANGGKLLARQGGVPFIGAEAGYDEFVVPMRSDVIGELAGALTAAGAGGGIVNHFPAGTDPMRVAEAQRRYNRRNGLRSAA